MEEQQIIINYQFVDVQCILQFENFKNTFNVDAHK